MSRNKHQIRNQHEKLSGSMCVLTIIKNCHFFRKIHPYSPTRTFKNDLRRKCDLPVGAKGSTLKNDSGGEMRLNRTVET